LLSAKRKYFKKVTGKEETRILITGAKGFVGSHLLNELRNFSKDRELRVCCSDYSVNEDVSLQESTNFKVSWERLDVTDQLACELLIQEFDPHITFHLAGIAFGPEADKDFAKVVGINVVGTFNVCRALSLVGSKTQVSSRRCLLHISSSEVFGVPQTLPVDHLHPAVPANAYGVTKLQSESVVRYAHRRLGVCCAIARPFNHLGRGQNEQFVAPAFAKQIVEIEKGLKLPVLEVGNLDAERDFCDVRDVVRGYRQAGFWLLEKSNLEMADKDVPIDEPEILVFCSGNPVKVSAILGLLKQNSTSEFEVKLDPRRLRPAEVPQVYGTFSNVRTLFGWQPTFSLEETLAEVVDDWRQRV